jgi:hypothetical protein
VSSVKVTAPRVVAFWGFLLAVLLVLCAAGHESWVDLSLWAFAVTVLYFTAALAWLANRRAPVHRGSYAWPVSSSPALCGGGAIVLAALASVYGIWFAVMIPVPAGLGLYLGIRDRKLRQRMLTAGAVDPTAPPYLAGAGHPREIPEWPDAEPSPNPTSEAYG